jgi:hypothetical protein
MVSLKRRRSSNEDHFLPAHGTHEKVKVAGKVVDVRKTEQDLPSGRLHLCSA